MEPTQKNKALEAAEKLRQNLLIMKDKLKQDDIHGARAEAGKMDTLVFYLLGYLGVE